MHSRRSCLSLGIESHWGKVKFRLGWEMQEGNKEMAWWGRGAGSNPSQGSQVCQGPLEVGGQEGATRQHSEWS